MEKMTFYKLRFVSQDGKMKVDIMTTDAELKSLRDPVNFLNFYLKKYKEFVCLGYKEVEDPFGENRGGEETEE